MRLFKRLGRSKNIRRARTIVTAAGGLSIMLLTAGYLGGNSIFINLAEAEPLCEGSGVPIWITIEKVRNSKGTIKVELYNGEVETGKKKGKKIARTRVKASQGETKLCLNAPSRGDYSISLYHDENDNKKFDRNFIGIPREGFGFSNNPSIGFGLPDEEEIRFQAKQTGINLRISVVYL
jgi:uncharacterized protein (DUF2141 family)